MDPRGRAGARGWGGLGGGPAFGGKGYFAATPEALHQALAEALKTNAPTLINTMISPYGQRKAQVRLDWARRAPSSASSRLTRCFHPVVMGPRHPGVWLADQEGQQRQALSVCVQLMCCAASVCVLSHPHLLSQDPPRAFVPPFFAI